MRFLRGISGVLLGLLVLAGARAPAYAAVDGSISVRPYVGIPPDAINDLAAAPTALAGQLRLTWTAPIVFPGSVLDAYEVRVQTFSLADVGGSTTTWWNNPTGLTIQGLYGESPGQAVARTLGPPGSSHTAALTPGATYYLAVRSADDLGFPRNVWSDVTMVVSGIPSTAPPIPLMTPNGVLSTSLSSGLQVSLIWTPVTRDINGDPVTVDHYLVTRSSAIGSPISSTITVAGSTSNYSENTGGTVYYYRIQAVGTSGGVSGYSDYLDSSLQANRYALSSDDITTRVVMPHDAALYLLAANNPYNADLEIVVDHQPQDEVNMTLRSYRVSAQIAATGQVLTGFAFPQNNISVEMGYGSVIAPSGGPVSLGPQPVSAAALAQIISVYWYNGSAFIRVGSPILTLNQSIAVTVRNLGLYQIRAATLGSKFRLSQGSPYPRVITPNGAENRRVFWFYDNPTGDAVTGEIFDIRGAHVRDLAVNAMSPTANSLVWDGRDDRGAVVPSGVYLYKIKTTEDTVTGTVVVAR